MYNTAGRPMPMTDVQTCTIASDPPLSSWTASDLDPDDSFTTFDLGPAPSFTEDSAPTGFARYLIRGA